VAASGVGRDLTMTVRQGPPSAAPVPVRDPWNNWVMSLRGSVSVQGEESNREMELSGEVGADRVTDAWKITIGGQFDEAAGGRDLHVRIDLQHDRESQVRQVTGPLVSRRISQRATQSSLRTQRESLDSFSASARTLRALRLYVVTDVTH
jgi:hypothetical protein